MAPPQAGPSCLQENLDINTEGARDKNLKEAKRTWAELGKPPFAKRPPLDITVFHRLNPYTTYCCKPTNKGGSNQEA